MLVAAPTGSGKTLAYALPIVAQLQQRVLPCLRVLVVVPTRDLALQVRGVFAMLLAGTPLRITSVTGETAFREEQRELTVDPRKASDVQPHAGRGLVDMLVCTPGRLVDHIRGTPGFTLQHVQYLVVDEVDRLLGGAFQGWLELVLSEIYHRPQSKSAAATEQYPVSTRGGPQLMPYFDPVSSSERPVHKLFFSATLTKNARKIAQLQLFRPTFFAPSTQGFSYKMPALLEETVVQCGSRGEKPLALIHLLTTVIQNSSVIVFASSVETTHRLFRLIKIFNPDLRVAEYSSRLEQSRRTGVLQSFKQGVISVLICSDAMARGIDIDGIDAVINYDTPQFIKTYVHRAGRTARAGKPGATYTLVSSAHERHRFEEMLKKAEKQRALQRMIVSSEQLATWVPRYEDSLRSLEHELSQTGVAARNELSTVKRFLEFSLLGESQPAFKRPRNT